MEHQSQRRTSRRRHRYLPGAVVTATWMTLAMVVMAVGGFFLAQNVFAKKLLQDSKIQHDKVRPVRILTPQEAAKLSSDQSSHVWTEGLRDSDVPDVAPSYTRSDDSTPRNRQRKQTRPPKSRTHMKRTPADVPADTPTEITIDSPTDTALSDGDTGDNTPDTAPPATNP